MGEVNVVLSYGRRITDIQAIKAFTKASGRIFTSYIDQLMRPKNELVRQLRKPHPAENHPAGSRPFH